MRSADSLATILLVSRLAGDGLKPLKAMEFWWLREQVANPGALLGRSVQDLTGVFRDAPSWAGRVAALLDRATAMAFELDRLDASGVRVLTPFDDHYPPGFPARLGVRAPPLLYVAGAAGLLESPGLGVVGSRDVSADGATVAVALGQRAVHMGRPLVSGGARGVDRLAMNSSLEEGGRVVAMIGGSLADAVRNPNLRRALQRVTTVLCSPYGPDVPFSVGNALGRNKLVYAQSVLTVVVACETERGGTWSGAAGALGAGFGSVAVWRGSGEGGGNAALEGLGAMPIRSIEEIQR